VRQIGQITLSKQVTALLDAEYGRREWHSSGPLIDELILTILSQNTTAANCERAFLALRARFGSWTQVAQVSLEDIERAIAPAGLAGLRAPRILSILESLSEKTGVPDLEWLAELDNDAAIAFLTRLNGVGRKTAACVLMFGLGRPVMPVDTHVHRLVMRLGLIPSCSADQAHDLLASVVEPEDVYTLHLNLVAHGRAICRPTNPKCEACCLSGVCVGKPKSILDVAGAFRKNAKGSITDWDAIREETMTAIAREVESETRH